MKYIDGFRAPEAAAMLSKHIRSLGAELQSRDVRVNVMEVCGSHTMAIARYGIRGLLPDNVNLISGPGCPVCVTSPGYIDAAVSLAKNGAIVATFGDMINVPGSDTTLAECRSEGGRVEVCYSPSSAVSLAESNPDKEVVFLSIGFETTIGPVVSIAEAAIKRDIKITTILTAFKLVPPALAALLADPELRINAFLCPAHVSAIIGSEAYEAFSGTNGVPCVVAGFEPLDILMGMEGILKQIVNGDSCVENQYSRVVKSGGNLKARALMDKYLTPGDADWRGIGVIPDSGLVIREQFGMYDAERRLEIAVGPGKEHPGCICGDVIKGKCSPVDCPMFATACHPDHPVGPCMVSAEGTCAAYFKYSR